MIRIPPVEWAVDQVKIGLSPIMADLNNETATTRV